MRPVPPLLAVDRLRVAYGKVEAVHEVSMHVDPGEIVCVVGANGAGKTTLLAALMGLLPARGDILWDGVPVGHLTVEQRVGRGLSLVPERRELFATLSVADNLALGALACRHRDRGAGSRAARAARLETVHALFPRLRERRSQAAGTLSGGERQMLALGRALMSRPRLLMLDEPSLGLAPRLVREIFAAIARLRADGTSVLLVEQNARAALQLANRAYVLETGSVVLHAAAAELLDDPRLVASYLGLQAAGG